MLNALRNYTMKSILTVSTLAISALVAAPAIANDSLSGHVTPNKYSDSVAPQLSETYSVGLNKTEIVRLPVAAAAILVGNPAIADVSIHSSNTFFVVGRSYGETNIVILDDRGHEILDANIQVSNILPRNGVRVFYGANERETYNCTPNCTAAPVLGDTSAFIAANSAASPAINNTIALGNSSLSSTNNQTDFTDTNGPIAGSQ